nr:hypothetical protein [Tanacetum cinerariifolium]
TTKNTEDEGNDDASLGLNVGSEEGHDADDDEDELYRDVNINLEGRDVQMTNVHTTQEFEDTHMTLTLVNPDGIDSLFETPPEMDVPTLTTVVSFTLTAPTLPPPTILTSSQVQKAPTPPTTAPSNLLYMDQQMNEAVKVAIHIQSDRLRDEAQAKNEEFLKNLDENIPKIIKEQVKEQVKVQVSMILPKIEKTVNEQLEVKVLTRSSNSSKTSYAVAADLSEIELKKILIEKIESNKHRDDADKDEEPSAGSDRGSKRRREGKETEPTSAPKEKATKTTGKSTQGYKSQQKSASESAPVEEPIQKTQDLEEPSHQEFETGAADDQPIAEACQHPEWFQQQKKPLTHDRAWNKTLPATHESIQTWISDLAKQADSRSSFNELMDTPVDFSVFLMNQLKVDTLTPELLAGPTYELMKGSCKSLVELEFFLEEVYKFYGFVVNRESTRDVYSKHKIIAITELHIVEWHNYKHLDWITVRRDDDKLYKFKEGVESYQKKLNLTKPDTYRSDLKRKEAYTAYCNPRGLIYQNKEKQNRLMRIDELHKYSDGTLNDVRTALDDRLKGIRMKYLPQAI